MRIQIAKIAPGILKQRREEFLHDAQVLRAQVGREAKLAARAAA